MPYHEARGVTCERWVFGGGTGMVKAYPPRDVRPWGNRADDVAYWSVAVYQWNGEQWIHYTGTGWMSYAYVNRGGLSHGTRPGWRNSRSHGQQQFAVLHGMPAGAYTVLHRISWQSTGYVHAHWSPISCRIP